MSTTPGHSHQHSHHHPHQHIHGGQTLLETLLDLDSHIHRRLLDDALTMVTDHLRPDEVRRVLDIGAGRGAATFRLSELYPDAEIIAVDVNPAMTRQIAHRAAETGQSHVTTLNRPVETTSLDAGSVDLVWASSVIHEFSDPDQVLGVFAELLRPGGVLAVMEMDGPPRVLPEEPEEYGALERTLRHLSGADLPSPEWGGPITDAGLTLLEKRTLHSDQFFAWDGPGGDYARAELERLARHAAGGLDADQRSALAHILTDTGAPHPAEARIRGTRSLWIARHV